ncbi:PspC domain-containing protein [Naumannella cuiyingiana]|uniref:Phage shock protein PspC (Stress-responsive transcriptional regulator) n=1 Tax=Naumannella cuiyingiana TaxID=1347891 RepID=A0A7Z0D7I6_9ACTN|nr:PspC domain-containing protein [Naumannella cuiyingiana]NYI70319.1 phage shock protein PspC (stress-responsive transcriptional regulator) [Naumannella cuiyingiana]
MEKKLTRSSSDKILGGVCGGIARYLGVDAGLTRLVTVALILFTGIGPFAYLAAWFLLPDEQGRSGLDWAIQQMRGGSDRAASNGTVGTPGADAPHRGDDLR